MVALIASAGINILLKVIFGDGAMALQNINILGICLFGSAFFVLRKFKWNPILVMTLCGVIGLAVGTVLGI